MAIEAKCRAKLEACAAARIDPVAGDALWHLDRPRMLAVADEAAKVPSHGTQSLTPFSLPASQPTNRDVLSTARLEWVVPVGHGVQPH